MPTFGRGPTMSAGGGGGGAGVGMANGDGGADPAVARMLAARARDPKWNMFGPQAYQDQYALTGHGKSVTDAINAGETVQPWAPSSGVGPGTRGYTGSFGQEEEGGGFQQPFQTGRPASEIPGAVRQRTSQIRPLAPTFYAHGTSTPVPPGMPLIAGDAQEDGKPNEELIIPTPQGTHVIPLKDLPKMGDGTVSVKDKGQDTIRAKTSGLKPPTNGLANFYKLNPSTPPAANMEAEKLILNPKIPMPIRIPKLAYGTRHHHRGEDTRAPVSRAGRTGGLSEFYGNQDHLALERGARGAIDPITGISETPSQQEMSALLARLADRPHEAELMRRYFSAKQSGHPEFLAMARDAVMQRKAEINALYNQQQRQPQAQPHGVPWADAPVTGRTASLAPPAPVASETPPTDGLAPPTLIPGLTAKTASIAPRTISNQYGTGSITSGPRTSPPVFNLTDTYDPKFGDKVVTAAESAQVPMTSEPDAMPEMPMLEGQNYTDRPEGAVVEDPEVAKQRALVMKQNLGRTASLSGGAGQAISNVPVGAYGPMAAMRASTRGLPKLLPAGVFGR